MLSMLPIQGNSNFFFFLIEEKKRQKQKKCNHMCLYGISQDFQDCVMEL